MKLLVLVAMVLAGCSFQANPAKADSRMRIYVLDTKIPSTYLNRTYICSDKYERIRLIEWTHNPHGSNITEIIGMQIDTDKYCVYPVNVYVGTSARFDQAAYIKALEDMNKDPKAIGTTMAMSGESIIPREKELLHEISLKAHVVISAGNESKTLRKGDCPIYPACFKLNSPKLIIVSATDVESANQPVFDHVIAPGKDRGYSYILSGTSQAAAEHTAKIFKKVKKSVQK